MASGFVFPEHVIAIHVNQLVPSIVGFSRFECRHSSHHDVQDYSNSEKIYLLSIIVLFSMNLRSHIAFSSKLSSEIATTSATCKRSCETKICNLEVEICIHKNVLRL